MPHLHEVEAEGPREAAGHLKVELTGLTQNFAS
jgi:hypothetical protein